MLRNKYRVLPIAYCLLPLLLLGSRASRPVSQPSATPSTPTYLVVIDPAHGGSETGARIAPNVPEKDLTLLLGRKLHEQLESRNIASTLLRDDDSDLSLDRRAVLANLARPVAFISLHAEPGPALRIYTAALPQGTESQADRNGFLLWNSAQAAFTKGSASLANEVAQALEKRELSSQVMPAFLNPLDSIAAPAIAVEAPADHNGLRISPDVLMGAVAEAIAVDKLHAEGAK